MTIRLRLFSVVGCFLVLVGMPVGPAEPSDSGSFEWEPLLWGGEIASPSAILAPHAPEATVDDAETPIATTLRDPALRNVGNATNRNGLFAIGIEGTESPSPPLFATLPAERVASKPAASGSASWYRAPYRLLVLNSIPPLYLSPELPGEGVWQWRDIPTAPDGKPVMFRTSYRPSTQYPNAIAHMLLLDMKRLSIRLYIGSSEPGGSQETSTMAPSEKARLLAVTNGMWKQKHAGDAGTIYQGQVVKPLVMGLATMVILKNGRVDILEWNNQVPLWEISDAKQLRHLIVKDGKVVESVMVDGRRTDSEIGLGFLLSETPEQNFPYWYGFQWWQPQQQTEGSEWFIATRSAFGIRRDGNLVFAAGYHISTKDLAKALVLAGCDRAIHADANPHNVLGILYYNDWQGGLQKRAKLSPDQKDYTLGRYDKSYTNDFFGFFIKEDVPTASTAGARPNDSARALPGS